MEQYDVIVIGAGNGGLTASASLAGQGFKVLLLERHNIPGGCATSFCRGRFEFEVALHQLSGMGTPNKPGPLRMLLQELGVLEDLDFVEQGDLYSIVSPDGFRLTLKPDRNEVISELSSRFPDETDSIGKFIDLCYAYANQMLAAFWFKDPQVTREKYPVLFEYAFKPANEVVDSLFKDPLLKAVISVYWGYLGLPLTRLSFAYLAMLFFTYIEFKPFHLKGGSQALSNAILHRFLGSGGSARFNCSVDRIIVEDGRAKGVITEEGEEFRSAAIVSNASQPLTYVKMIGEENTPKDVKREMRGRSLSPSAFTMYLGFDCEPSELGITEATNFIMSDPEMGDSILAKMREVSISDELMVMSCYDVSDPEFSPRGACQANIVTLKYGEPWMRIPPDQYHEIKMRCADSMMNLVEKVFPNVRKHVEEAEVATPLTHMRYLGHPEGAIYGFEQYTKDSMFFQPSRKSPIKGLYFAGGWAGDCGFQTTLQAGVSVGRSVGRSLK